MGLGVFLCRKQGCSYLGFIALTYDENRIYVKIKEKQKIH